MHGLLFYGEAGFQMFCNLKHDETGLYAQALAAGKTQSVSSPGGGALFLYVFKSGMNVLWRGMTSQAVMGDEGSTRRP